MTSGELLDKIQELFPNVIISLNLKADVDPACDLAGLPDYALDTYAEMVTNGECTVKDVVESYYKDCYDEVLDIDCEDVRFTYEH